MSNEAVKRWTQQGRVFCWRYKRSPRSYAGWHMTADGPGCRSLLELTGLMLGSPYAATVHVRLSPVTPHELRVPNAGRPAASAETLSLAYAPGRVPADHWALSARGPELTLSLGRGCLEQLRQGVEDIEAGNGDYCIGGDDDALLWFWWRLAEEGAARLRRPTAAPSAPASRSSRPARSRSGSAFPR